MYLPKNVVVALDIGEKENNYVDCSKSMAVTLNGLDPLENILHEVLSYLSILVITHIFISTGF